MAGAGAGHTGSAGSARGAGYLDDVGGARPRPPGIDIGIPATPDDVELLPLVPATPRSDRSDRSGSPKRSRVMAIGMAPRSIVFAVEGATAQHEERVHLVRQQGAGTELSRVRSDDGGSSGSVKSARLLYNARRRARKEDFAVAAPG